MNAMSKLPRAITVDNILTKNIETYTFSEDFYNAFRNPAKKGVWAVVGNPSSGKSTFTMMLAKEFAKQTKVLYNMREEVVYSLEVQGRLNICKMGEVKKNYLMAEYGYMDLIRYLNRRTSPDVIILDSAAYHFTTIEDYFELKNRFKNKIFIITLHAQGSQPRTEMEKSIYYDANQKVFVAGYQAVCKGRTIGPTGSYIIWEDGYSRVHGINQ